MIGSNVRNASNETIGRVYDIIMDANGTPRTLVISAGGVMGIGGRRAAVPLSNVRFATIAGAAHSVHWEKPAEVAAALNAFFAAPPTRLRAGKPTALF